MNLSKKRYIKKLFKILHKTLYATQLACNSSSVISATCTAGGLVTRFGAAVAVPLGFFSVVSSCIGIFMGIFDQNTLKKMKKTFKTGQVSSDNE